MPAFIQQPPAPPALVQVNGANPVAVYRAFNAQRQELAKQLEQLEDRRSSMQSQIQEGTVPAGVARTGMEARIADIDKRIADVDKQLAAADLNVANAAATPGAVQVDRPQVHNGPPDGVFVLSGMFIVFVMLPISFSIARRIWRRGKDSVVAFPQELAERLNRLDQAVDSIAVEVERIGEGQRFVTRVMSDGGRGLGAGAAVPIDVAARERARVPREGERGSI